GGLGLDLRIGLARALAGHRNLDAGVALEGSHHLAAPFFLYAAVDGERALGRGWRGRAHGQQDDRRGHRAGNQPSEFPDHHFLPCRPTLGLGTPASTAGFVSLCRIALSPGVQASTALPLASPLLARKSFAQPPASRTMTKPASASQALMCASK